LKVGGTYSNNFTLGAKACENISVEFLSVPSFNFSNYLDVRYLFSNYFLITLVRLDSVSVP
jgi:hypothetical protein